MPTVVDSPVIVSRAFLVFVTLMISSVAHVFSTMALNLILFDFSSVMSFTVMHSALAPFSVVVDFP